MNQQTITIESIASKFISNHAYMTNDQIEAINTFAAWTGDGHNYVLATKEFVEKAIVAIGAQK